MKLDSEANLLYADLTLELILVDCESLTLRKHIWPSVVSVSKLESLLDSHCIVPLMVWLCQVIDNCRNLWLNRDQYCLQKAVLKGKAVTALNSLLEMVVSCEDEMSNETEKLHGKTACILTRKLPSLIYICQGVKTNET